MKSVFPHVLVYEVECFTIVEKKACVSSSLLLWHALHLLCVKSALYPTVLLLKGCLCFMVGGLNGVLAFVQYLPVLLQIMT